MQGMDLSKKYFEEFGRFMLEEKFRDILPFLAVGLTGSGSECFGYDDEKSQDHDFEPGFCIFIPDEEICRSKKTTVIIDTKEEFRLQREYDKLPSKYMGFTKPKMKPVGGNRKGVIRIGDFFAKRCGNPIGEISGYDWLSVPEYALAEAVNGEIFFDNYGLMTSIREKIKHYPEDIRIKKMAEFLLMMAQAGQYNYNRCVNRGENAAAQMSIYKFAEAGMHVIFLLNRKYMPYYKWSFRALKDLTRLGNIYDSLEYLICSDNDGKHAVTKASMIEDIAAVIIKELKAEGLTSSSCNDLEKHAYAVNDHIKDGTLRNMGI